MSPSRLPRSLSRAAVIGIDIGGTKCAVSLLTRNGQVQRVHTIPTSSPATTLDKLAEAVRSLGRLRDPVFGIACGSPQDSARGTILAPANLPTWKRVKVVEYFTAHFGGRAFLMNDANANALAEWKFGAGRRCRSMVFLTAGTGMGAGLVLDGRLFTGACDNAGEVGHIRLAPRGPTGCYKPGSFEGFCSGGGIARLVRYLPARLRPRACAAWIKTYPTTRDIAAAARRGDRTAREVFAEAGRRYGEALAILIDTLNPDRIVIGSLWLRCRDLLEPEMRRVLKREALPASRRACRIVAARLGERVGDYGAVCVALHGLGTLPDHS